jgi:lipoprotein-releasing system permease protein
MYKIILALRYLIRRRITYFAVLAVALCVFIVVVVMTVMTGLVGTFKHANHEFVGDCVVGTKSLVGFAYHEEFLDELARADFVAGTSPVVNSYGLVSPKTGDVNRGVQIMGVDPLRHSSATGFRDSLYFNRNDVAKAFLPSYDPNRAGCILGIDLLYDRNERSEYPTETGAFPWALSISCFPLTAKGALRDVGLGLAATQTFWYSDHFHSGLARVDGQLVYLPLEQAQILCGMDGPPKRISAIHVRLKPGIKAEDGRHKIAAIWQKFKQTKQDERYAHLLDTVNVQTWKENRRTFIAAMEKEQAMMATMFCFVGITTVFIIVVVFYMIVSHKSKDIGILKSVGVSNTDIVELFAGFAFIVGLLGSAFGLIGGTLFLANINRIEDLLFERIGWQLWDRTIYAIGDIPNQAEFHVLAIIAASAIVACLIGAFVPSWQVARRSPVDILQVNQL